MNKGELPTGKLFPPVTCIILNWNGWRDTLECLQALKDCIYTNLTVVVVDNGSSNDSVARIKAARPDILLLESGKNVGFAAGNNLGIRHAIANGSKYVWLLNNDTRPASDALTALVTKAMTDDRIAAVGSVCYHAESRATVEAWGGARINLWVGYGRNSTEPREDGWFHSLNGTSILVSIAAIKDAGFLDEGFFLYWEDTEFCLRLRKRGWRIAVAADSRITHKVHGSTAGDSLKLDRYQTASGLRLLRLHSPAPRLASIVFLTVRLARRLLRFQFARCRSVWTGIQDYRERLPVSPRIR